MSAPIKYPEAIHINTAHILSDNGKSTKLKILIQEINVAIMKAAAAGKQFCIVDIEDEVLLEPLQKAFVNYKIEPQRYTIFRITWGYPLE